MEVNTRRFWRQAHESLYDLFKSAKRRIQRVMTPSEVPCWPLVLVWFLEGIDVPISSGDKKSGIRIMWFSKIKLGASMTEG